MAKTELQRLLSKRGIASRKDAAQIILEGKVKLNGRVCKDPSLYVDLNSSIEVTGLEAHNIQKHYLMLNKPRGLIVTRSDEKGRSTVYECLSNWQGPLVQAVGRLDQASEGLLLFTNDHQWANKLMDPETHVKKVYHVQVSPIPSPEILKKLSEGIVLEGSKTLPSRFEILRTGEKNAWLNIELSEGKNRQIRNMLKSENIEVLRLIRIKIGNLELGSLPKGEWRELTSEEISYLA